MWISEIAEHPLWCCVRVKSFKMSDLHFRDWQACRSRCQLQMKKQIIPLNILKNFLKIIHIETHCHYNWTLCLWICGYTAKHQKKENYWYWHTQTPCNVELHGLRPSQKIISCKMEQNMRPSTNHIAEILSLFSCVVLCYISFLL